MEVLSSILSIIIQFDACHARIPQFKRMLFTFTLHHIRSIVIALFLFSSFFLSLLHFVIVFFLTLDIIYYEINILIFSPSYHLCQCTMFEGIFVLLCF